MRLLLTVVVEDEVVDLAVDGEDDARVGDLAVALSASTSPPPLYAGRDRLDPDQPLVLSPVRHGSVLGLGAPVDGWTGEPDGLLEVRITGGPGAGTVARLDPGEFTLGGDADVLLPEPGLPDRCATLLVRSDGEAELLRDADGPTHWAHGRTVTIGGTRLDLVASQAPDASLSSNPAGATVDYNRPPRLLPPGRRTAFTLPPEPRRPEKQPIPALMVLLPLVIGGVLVVVTHSASSALFMLMSPLMMVGNVASGRRTDTKRFRREHRAYSGRTRRIRRDALDALGEECTARRRDFADPAEILLTAVGPRARLWERRRTDQDFLVVRIGTADRPSEVTLDGQAWTASDVPVLVDLASAGVTGIAGPDEERLGLARWVVAQAVVLQSPADVDLVLLTDRERADDWGWVRWIPHVRSDPGDAELAHVGVDEESTRRRIAELVDETSDRRDQPPASFRPVLVVLDGARRLRLLPGVPDLLQQGPRVGVYFLCLDTDERLLPEECTAVVTARRDLSLRVTGRETVEGIRADLVDVPWAERVARSLAPVRDVSDPGGSGSLPSESRLLDVVGLDPPSADRVLERWTRIGRTTRAVIGEGPVGPFSIDLVRDGPHGLVAGTTGSGKSELLQTIVASLAADNRPDEMSFVLIDYKGGAAFEDCRHLPHTVGLVTDLDGHLTTRALESLGAELRRRERRLAAAGAKDVEDYLAAKAPDDEPMPRLLIVIDEFAALVAELPDFVNGLVDIARRGRSLGVHLILATQRPAGVVSAEIKANTHLRIALRVTDPGDSSDVIETNDAAQIAPSTPGRAYARLGAASLVPFQASRVGGRPRGHGSAITLRPLELASCGSPHEIAQPEEDVSVPTDLAAFVAAARAASRVSGIAAPPSPWLPPLPEVVTLRQVQPAVPDPDSLVLPFGLVDVPAEQRRDIATYDLARGGHLAVVSAPRAGRSTTLRALAGAVGAYTSPADVHVYAVDCGHSALLPLVALPHVGAVVTRDQPDRMERLLSRLQDVVAERQQVLAIGGFADVTEQRSRVAPEDRLPYLVVLFDRWEGFVQAYDEVDGGRLVIGWQQVLQEGAAVGVKVVVTGDRSLTLGRMSTLVDDTLMLRMTDPSDFHAVGLTARQVPARMVDGRGFRAEGSRETQVALLDDDPSGAAQVRALQDIGRTAAERYAGLDRRPFRLDVLPTRIGLAEAVRLPHEPWSASTLAVAVGGDTLGLRTLDAYEHGPGLLVTGGRRSGRSTVLRTMATLALDAGWQVVVVTPRLSPLRDLAGRDGVHGPFDESGHELAALLASLLAGEAPSLTLVDDLELVGTDGPLPDLLGEHLERIRDSGSVLAAAGSPTELGALYRGPAVALKRSGSGLMLAPQTAGDADLFGARLPRSALGRRLPPGGGFLIRSGTAERVQVIWPE